LTNKKAKELNTNITAKIMVKLKTTFSAPRRVVWKAAVEPEAAFKPAVRFCTKIEIISRIDTISSKYLRKVCIAYLFLIRR